MDAQTLAYVIGKLRFSESLPQDVLSRLAAIATLRGFPAGTVVFREGAQNNQIMIICVGLLALDMHVPGRGDVRIMSLGPGDMVAWSSLLDEGRMTATAVALEDTQVVCIPSRDVHSLCETDPAAGYAIMGAMARSLASRLVATRLQLLDLFGDTTPNVPRESDRSLEERP